MHYMFVCANLTTLKFDLPIDTLASIVVGFLKNESMGTGRLNPSDFDHVHHLFNDYGQAFG